MGSGGEKGIRTSNATKILRGFKSGSQERRVKELLSKVPASEIMVVSMLSAHLRPVNIAKDMRAKTLPTMDGIVLTANRTDLTKAQVPFPRALQCAILQRSSQAFLTSVIGFFLRRSLPLLPM